MSASIFAVMVLVVVAGAALGGTVWVRHRRGDALEGLARFLVGGRVLPLGDGVTGQRRKVDLRVTFVTEGSGSSASQWTHIDVERMPEGLDLALGPRPFTHGLLVANELALDLTTGDGAFDAAFVVEGAPQKQIRALLDAEVRGALLLLAPVHLSIAGGKLRLRKERWIWKPETLEAFADAGALLAVRATASVSDVVAMDEGRMVLYREAAPPAAEGTEEEHARLLAIRDRRELMTKRLRWGVVFGVMVVFASITALRVCGAS